MWLAATIWPVANLEGGDPIRDSAVIGRQEFVRLSTSAGTRVTWLRLVKGQSWTRYFLFGIAFLFLVVLALLFRVNPGSALTLVLALSGTALLVFLSIRLSTTRQAKHLPENIEIDLELTSSEFRAELLEMKVAHQWSSFTSWHEYDDYLLLMREGFPPNAIPTSHFRAETLSFIRSRLTDSLDRKSF